MKSLLSVLSAMFIALVAITTPTEATSQVQEFRTSDQLSDGQSWVLPENVKIRWKNDQLSVSAGDQDLEVISWHEDGELVFLAFSLNPDEGVWEIDGSIDAFRGGASITYNIWRNGDGLKAGEQTTIMAGPGSDFGILIVRECKCKDDMDYCFVSDCQLGNKCYHYREEECFWDDSPGSVLFIPPSDDSGDSGDSGDGILEYDS